jgi:hypothetical protein
MGLVAAGTASATPVTYYFTSGQVTITATAGTTTVLDTTVVPLDGAYVAFDESTIDVTDLLLTIPTSGIIGLDVAYGGYDEFRIESADISPAPGYTTLFGQDNGSGNFSFVAAPLDINGVYSAFDSTMTNPDVNDIAAPFTDMSSINGSININTGVLTLVGITLASLPGSEFGEGDDLVVKADITVTGVPEPSTALLTGLGLTALAATSSRRRKF